MKKIIFPLFVLLVVGLTTMTVESAYAQNGPALKETNPDDHIDPNPLNIKAFKAFEALKVYATGGELKVEFENSLNGQVQVQLFDITGKEVFNEKVEKSSEKLEFRRNVSSFSKSIYIVRLTQEKFVTAKKLYL